jgi:hypothetical protein
MKLALSILLFDLLVPNSGSINDDIDKRKSGLEMALGYSLTDQIVF